MTDKSFDPNKTNFNADTLDEWLNSPVGENLEDCPGIGPANADILRSHGVTTTFQLLALFLSLKGPRVGSVEICERFYQQLATGKINAKRGEITQAVAMKLNNSFPGIWNPEAYR